MDEVQLKERRNKTILLLAGGVVSLLLPLAGVFYLRWRDASSAVGPSGSTDFFERREGVRITPSQTVTPNNGPLAPGASARGAPSSLDFVKGSTELKNAPPTAAAAPSAAAPAAASPAPAARGKRSKSAKGKKPFVMPKLQPSRGFSNFGSGQGAGAGSAPQSGQNAQQMLQNLPPGAQNNPDIQKYLQQQQGK